MRLPTNSISLMNDIYRKAFPIVHKELAYWKEKAEEIPNEELRNQALASIEHKTFHCEGGGIMGLTALESQAEAIRFIVAYQTISDYLDNLCDRSTSLDPDDFTALHESMEDALTIGAQPRDYYRFRDDKNDAGYLVELMQTCQDVLKNVKHYEIIRPYLLELCAYYRDLQIHKHVRIEEREKRLIAWYNHYKNDIPEMEWYEFSACSGSTLGIFCLVSYGFREDFEPKHAKVIKEGYFPYIHGLHILLDYFIDQEEDRKGGDLNFCFYYDNDEQIFERLIHFVDQADYYTEQLPDKQFHKFINRGLLGVYLSDEKAREQRDVRRYAKKLIKHSGSTCKFFYWNGRMYRSFRKVLNK